MARDEYWKLDDLSVNPYTLTFVAAKTREAFDYRLARARGTVWSNAGTVLCLSVILHLYNAAYFKSPYTGYLILIVLAILVSVLATRTRQFKDHSGLGSVGFILLLTVLHLFPVLLFNSTLSTPFFWVIIFLLHGAIPFMAVVLHLNFFSTLVLVLVGGAVISMLMAEFDLYPTWFLVPAVLVLDVFGLVIAYVHMDGFTRMFSDTVRRIKNGTVLLQDENKRKTEWMAQVAHDLGTPMTVIKLGLGRMMENGPFRSEIQELGIEPFVSMMLTTVDLMGLLRSNALDSSRVYLNRPLVPDMAAMDVRKLIRSCEGMMENMVLPGAVSLKFEVDGEVAQRVEMDENWCWQMLMNLLHTASKSCSSGHIIVRVTIWRGSALVSKEKSGIWNKGSGMTSTNPIHAMGEMQLTNLPGDVSALMSPVSAAMPPRHLHSGGNGDEHLRFSVEDTGPPVPPELERLLFEPFSELGLEGQYPSSCWSGLTLSGVAQKASALGGNADYYCGPAAAGHGGMEKVFYFQVPYRPIAGGASDCSVASGKGENGESEAHLVNEVRTPQQGQDVYSKTIERSVNLAVEGQKVLSTGTGAGASPKPGRATNRLLVVDDDQLTCTMVQTILEQMGWSVDIANNGQVGLDMITANASKAKAGLEYEYEVVLTDQHMPVLTGLEMATRIRELCRQDALGGRRHIPLCIMTAGGSVYGEIGVLVNQGVVDDAIEKPISLTKLVKILNELVLKKDLSQSESQPVRAGILRVSSHAKEDAETPGSNRGKQQTCGIIEAGMQQKGKENEGESTPKRPAELRSGVFSMLTDSATFTSGQDLEVDPVPDDSEQAANLGRLGDRKLTRLTDLSVNSWTLVFNNKETMRVFEDTLLVERSKMWRRGSIVFIAGSVWHIMNAIRTGPEVVKENVPWLATTSLLFGAEALFTYTREFRRRPRTYLTFFLGLIVLGYAFVNLTSAETYTDRSFFWASQSLFIVHTIFIAAVLNFGPILMIMMPLMYAMCICYGVILSDDTAREQKLYTFTSMMATVSIGFVMARHQIWVRIESFGKLVASAKYRENRLQDENKQKTKWIAQVAHDLGTPMTVVKLGLGWMMSNPILKKKAQGLGDNLLLKMETTMEVMIVLRSNAIDRARAYLDQPLLPEITPVDMRRLIKACWSMLECMASAQVGKGRLLLECNVDPSVPSTVMTDNVWCWQMLMNLLHNAAKHCSTGRIGLHVYLRETSTSVSDCPDPSKDQAVDVESGLAGMPPVPMLRFDVEDSGPPVPAELEGALFQAFSKSESPTGSRGGTGLGLCGVLQKATTLGGTAGYTGVYGNPGSTCPSTEKLAPGSGHKSFFIEIPCRQPTSAELAKHGQARLGKEQRGTSISNRPKENNPTTPGRDGGDTNGKLVLVDGSEVGKEFDDNESIASTSSGNGSSSPSLGDWSDGKSDDTDEDEAWPANTPRRRLLVVDDDPLTCTMIAITLKTSGWVVTTAQNGKEGLDLIKEDAELAEKAEAARENGKSVEVHQRFSVILTDLEMPTMNGVETALEYRKLQKRAMEDRRAKTSSRTYPAPLCLMTAGDSSYAEVKQLSDEKVISESIPKPLNYFKLLTILENLSSQPETSPPLR